MPNSFLTYLSKLRHLIDPLQNYSIRLILLLIILNFAEGCSDGYYLSNGWCFKCYSLCKTCTSYSYCTSCNDGYFIYARYYCLSCAQYPSQCPQKGLSPGVIAAIVLSSVVLIVIIPVINCKVRQHRLENQQPNRPNTASSMNIAEPQQEVHQQQLKSVRIKTFDQICSICLQKGNCQTRCGHIFHPHCLAGWVDKNSECPICRVEIATDRITVICETCLLGFTKRLDELVIKFPEQYKLSHICK